MRTAGPAADLTLISGTRVYAQGADWIELSLDAEITVNTVIRHALERATITQFNVVEPTLHEIFVRTVTSSNEQQVAAI
jgi:ABC-type uncharacterized transport system ATPase subunit